MVFQEMETEMQKTEGIPKKKGYLVRLLSFLKGEGREGTESSLLRLKETREQLMILVVSFAFILELIVIPASAYYYYTKISSAGVKKGFAVNESAKNRIVVVDFNEEIRITTYHKIHTLFEKLGEDDSVKEIILVMNTPGGSPSASEEISDYFKNYDKKKVSLYIQGIAASGGYYIASVFNPIVANPNAIVGSIGVIMPKYSLEKLADTLGVEEDPIIAGKYKHTVSILKTTDEATKEYLRQNLLLPTYSVFVNHVASNRGIERAELVEKYAEGRIFSASMEEIRGKLVDEVKNFGALKREVVSRVVSQNKGISKNDVGFDFIMLDQMWKDGLFFGDIGMNLKVDGEGMFESKLRVK